MEDKQVNLINMPKLKGQQTQVLYAPDYHNIFLRGTAGCGKSILALYRALYLSLRYPNKKILVTAFNNLVSDSMKENFNALKAHFGITNNNVEIKNFHLLMKDSLANLKEQPACEVFFDERGEVLPYFFNRWAQPLVKLALAFVYQAKPEYQAKYQGERWSAERLLSEFKYLMGCGVETMEEYLVLERRGRQEMRITKAEKPFVFDVFRVYQYLRNHTLAGCEPRLKKFVNTYLATYTGEDAKYMKSAMNHRRPYDFDNVGSIVHKKYEELGDESLKYDFIIIDEYQDFSKTQFAAILSLLKQDGHYFICGDPEQSIFWRTQSLVELGVAQNTYKTMKLKINYRNARKIGLYANKIKAHPLFNAPEQETISINNRLNGQIAFNSYQTPEDELAAIKQQVQNLPANKTACVICLEWDNLYAFDPVLGKKGLNIVETSNRIKGMEYDVVFIPGLGQAAIEQELKRGNQNPTQEELADRISKLLSKYFVCVTRAKEALYLSGVGPKSEFIADIPTTEEIVTYEQNAQLNSHAHAVAEQNAPFLSNENNKQEAEQVLTNRGVTRLIHFTKSKNVPLMLGPNEIGEAPGILANNFIRNTNFDPNDTQRFDGCTEHICTSITLPNIFLLNKFKRDVNSSYNQAEQFGEYVMLEIDPRVINRSDRNRCCEKNAATQRGRFIKEVNAFNLENCFANNILSPNNVADNLQAELLIYHDIPVEDIKGLIYPSKDQAQAEKLRLQMSGVPLSKQQIAIKYAPELFDVNHVKGIAQGSEPDIEPTILD